MIITDPGSFAKLGQSVEGRSDGSATSRKALPQLCSFTGALWVCWSIFHMFNVGIHTQKGNKTKVIHSKIPWKISM